MSIDSCFASPMNPQVLTTTIFASVESRVVHDFEAVVPQLGHQVLRVDPVFGASERDDVDLAFHGLVFVRCKNS